MFNPPRVLPWVLGDVSFFCKRTNLCQKVHAGRTLLFPEDKALDKADRKTPASIVAFFVSSLAFFKLTHAPMAAAIAPSPPKTDPRMVPMVLRS